MSSTLDAQPQSAAFHTLDNQYITFPRFKGWSPANLDWTDWDSAVGELQRFRSTLGDEPLMSAVMFTLRAAAIDTGAIEGLYSVDRGFTFSVAIEAAAWQAEADSRGADIRKYFEAQLTAHELILDAVSKQTPMSEAWLRAFHESICASQETYTVHTPAGVQEHPFVKGEYKVHPNHVYLPDGTTFSYAPVDRTPSEMHDFFEEIRSPEFTSAHPVLQASYSHYSLVKIHPFPDGNGRIARAIASLYLYRAASIPLLIFADQKKGYFNALETADKGDSAPFVEFTLQRAVDTMMLQIERLKSPQAPPPDVTIGSIQRLYYSQSGMHHYQLDEAAHALTRAAKDAIDRQLSQLRLPSEVQASAELGHGKYKRTDDGFRPPVKNGGLELTLRLNSAPPAQAAVAASFRVYISQEPSSEGRLLLRSPHGLPEFTARVADVSPDTTNVLEIRLSSWAERLIAAQLAQLQDQAQASLRDSGYA